MITIGRKEYVKIPIISKNKYIAKIDTGAYTNSIHIKGIVILTNGIEVTFDDGIKVFFNRGDYHMKKVISSNGTSEIRVLVKIKLKLGRKVYNTKFTLTDRSNMKNSILIGRKFLRNRFIVDVSKEFLIW
jgi:hypothetical protein